MEGEGRDVPLTTRTEKPRHALCFEILPAALAHETMRSENDTQHALDYTCRVGRYAVRLHHNGRPC